jgi:hypothetical protein
MAARDFMRTTPSCHIRTIKTGRMVYDYRRKTHHPPQAIVLGLQLKGHWLQQAGFNIDAPRHHSGDARVFGVNN